MAEEQKILVLLAAYNSQKYIEEQLLSILNQTHNQIHLLVSDDCSKDHTVDLIQQIDKKNPGRITLLTSTVNRGIIGNFSTLMQHADADYIMFSDGDDVWLPRKVEQTLAKMVELEQSSDKKLPLLVHTDLAVVDRNLLTIHPSFWRYTHLSPHRHQTLNRQMAQNVITGCTIMVNRALLELARPLPAGIMMHDWWLGLVALAFGRVGIVSESTMLYRQHGGNDTGAKKYGIVPFLKRVCQKNKVLKNVNRYSQAQLFLDCYQDRLHSDQLQAIQAFLHKEQVGFLSRFYLICKYRFFKHGFLRNLHNLFQ
ncbi:MAG: glycosyltransferase family 2 protein [Chlamydiales bacterium]